MTYTNTEEEHQQNKNQKLKIIVLITGIGLFVLSLFNFCFCTANGCRTSFEALLLGWLAMLTNGASVTWLANPFLIISWILISKNYRAAWLFGLIAFLISISFLKFQVVIEDEAGHYNPITKIGTGYWFWVSSCLITFLGSLILRILKMNKT